MLARPLAWGGWNCSAAPHFRVRYSVMGRQNYFTGCLSALLMDVRSANLSLYDFPTLKYRSSLSYWVCLLFSTGHGTKIYVALCDHTNHPSLLVTIKFFSLVLKSSLNWIPLLVNIPHMVKCLWTQRRQTLFKKHLCDLSRLLCLGESQGTKDDCPQPNSATWKLEKQVTLALPRANGKRQASSEIVHPNLK